MVYGDDGQPLFAEPSFVHGVADLIRAMGIQPGGQPKTAPAELPPEVAQVIAEKRLDKTRHYYKETYKADFDQVAPDVFGYMIQNMGIQPGSENDTAQAFEHAFLKLKAIGKLGSNGNGSGSQVKLPENKSQLKSQAQAASGAGHYKQNPTGLDYDTALKKAVKTASPDDWLNVVSAAVVHPDLKG